jgi:hypothetical protein
LFVPGGPLKGPDEIKPLFEALISESIFQSRNEPENDFSFQCAMSLQLGYCSSAA